MFPLGCPQLLSELLRQTVLQGLQRRKAVRSQISLIEGAVISVGTLMNGVHLCSILNHWWTSTYTQTSGSPYSLNTS